MEGTTASAEELRLYQQLVFYLLYQRHEGAWQQLIDTGEKGRSTTGRVPAYRRFRADLDYFLALPERAFPESVSAPHLFALGFQTPRTSSARREIEIDVVRADDYFVHRSRMRWGRGPGGAEESSDSGGLLLNSRPLSEGKVRLEEGRHRITVEPHSPIFVISPLPREVFQRQVNGNKDYSPLFEDGRRGIPWPR